ncbi:MAG: SocA family protein [Bacteroidetes bacterium]|nr:SocA family protein [Bacteroidota bacterium]
MLIKIKPEIRFRFILEKGTAMLQYLLKRVGGEYNYMSLLKLAFFADRFHVRQHARPVSMDEYYAFKYGVAGSQLKNIILEPEIFINPPKVIKRVKGYKVQLVSKKIDMDEFSKTEIEALEFSLNNFAEFGRINDFKLSEISHAYPEWAQYEDKFNAGLTNREDVDYEDFLKDPPKNHPIFLRNKFTDPFPKLEDSERLELIEEMQEHSIPLI